MIELSNLPQPVLVTGATGFIGRHLLDRLLKQGVSVRAFVLPGEAIPQSWVDVVDVRRGDVADTSSVALAVEGAGSVFHLAAVVGDGGAPSLHRTVTVEGTRHVLKAAAAVDARVVLASSIVVYGDKLRHEEVSEDKAFGRPLGPYSRSKQEQERIAIELGEKAGLRVTTVRPANVFGTGSGPWVDELARRLRAGKVTLIDGGRRCAGLCHVDNLVDVLLRAMTLDRSIGRVYNAADGSDITWRRYVSDLAELAATKPPSSAPRWAAAAIAPACEMIWRGLRFSARPPMTREAINLTGSDLRIPIRRAQDELGYEPTVDYPEALAGLEIYLRASV